MKYPALLMEKDCLLPRVLFICNVQKIYSCFEVSNLADAVGLSTARKMIFIWKAGMLYSYFEVSSLADGIGLSTAESDDGSILRGNDPVDVPYAPVRRAGGQKGLAPSVNGHQHLRQVVRRSRVDRNWDFLVAADDADGFVGGDVGAGEVGGGVFLQGVECLELVQGQGQRVSIAERREERDEHLKISET